MDRRSKAGLLLDEECLETSGFVFSGEVQVQVVDLSRLMGPEAVFVLGPCVEEIVRR